MIADKFLVVFFFVRSRLQILWGRPVNKISKLFVLKRFQYKAFRISNFWVNEGCSMGSELKILRDIRGSNSEAARPEGVHQRPGARTLYVMLGAITFRCTVCLKSVANTGPAVPGSLSASGGGRG